MCVDTMSSHSVNGAVVGRKFPCFKYSSSESIDGDKEQELWTTQGHVRL